LQRGAQKVYCIDVGYGQLDYKLRQDKRVINIEKTNFRYFDSGLIKDNIDFAVIDVSIISLDKILPPTYKIIKDNS
jgi:23S rRNA (cytidine1920-2'-O)/16S rRNA (cytidine1409-2'-O)-methyltransferase